MDQTHVTIQNVSKRFGETEAVNNLSLDIPRGSFTTLLGPSGCGKTTTLRMLAGFYEPDQGDILINGRSQRGLPPYRRNTSIVFQDYALFPHMTVLANVSYGLKLHHVPPPERLERTDKVLSFLGLAHLKERYPHELSGGQQQRVALGRSLVMEPEVLLMDEPLSNLDAKLRIRVRAELKEIQRTLGITTIYVTHDQDEALSLSDKIAVISDGQLQQYSDPWTLYNEPANHFVADFVGYANFLPVTTLNPDNGQVSARVLEQDIQCVHPPTQATSTQQDAHTHVMVRPEWFDTTLAPLGNDNQTPNEGLQLEGNIMASSFLGSHTRLWVRVGGLEEPIVVDTPAMSQDNMPEKGAVTLRLRHGKAVVVGKTPA